MKKVKIAILLVVLIIACLFIYQNRVFFGSTHTYYFDLGFEDYYLPNIPNFIFFGGAFVFGFLIAFISGLSFRVRSSATLKATNETIDAQLATIASLRQEVANLKEGAMGSQADKAEIKEMPSAGA